MGGETLVGLLQRLMSVVSGPRPPDPGLCRTRCCRQCPPEGPPCAHALRERCWNSCPKYLAPRQMPARPAALPPSSAISRSGVLQAAAAGLHESESHVSTPGPAHGGEENSVYDKRVPRSRGDSFADGTHGPGDRGRLPWAPLRPSCAGDWLSGTGELLPSWWSFGFFSLKKMHVVCQVV